MDEPRNAASGSSKIQKSEPPKKLLRAKTPEPAGEPQSAKNYDPREGTVSATLLNELAFDQ
jgi:hypothetical protein